AEEAAALLVPDGPRAEAVLAPLDIGRAGVAQGVRCIPRYTSMVGLVAACQREKPQPCRSKTGSFRVRPRRVALAASTHARSMTGPVRVTFPNTGPRETSATAMPDD